jgi:two-component system aerobic respiration control sensor histidine kinase ArcB
MTAFEASLESSPGRAEGPWADSRERAMLRHDIYGALHGIIGGLTQVDAEELSDAAREQLDRVSAAAKTLTRLVDALLGDSEAADAPATVNLQRFLRHMRRRYVGEASARGLRFVIEITSDLPGGLMVSPVSLVRILDNLVGNALKFAESGTIAVTVGRDTDGEIVFAVTDEGPGLGARTVEHPHGNGGLKPGQGLGLHIVRALADQVGGAVDLSNRPEGGVSAVLRLPARLGVARASAPDDLGSDLAGVRILLAEDNPTNQMVASQMLRALHAEVMVCSDGIEALERFENAVVDLVVVDIEMPRMSGLDVIRAIRGRGDARAQVPIVALTAYAMREHRERIAAAGANGLISKPVTSVEALGQGLLAHVPVARPALVRAVPAGDVAFDGEPVIDEATFAALCDAIGAEMMVELLEKVVTDLLGAQRDLTRALEPLDRAAMRSASHILISVAGALGAQRLQACARRLNAASPTDAPAVLRSAARGCIAEIDTAVAFARERRAES